VQLLGFAGTKKTAGTFDQQRSQLLLSVYSFNCLSLHLFQFILTGLMEVQAKLLEYKTSLKQFADCISYLRTELEQLRAGRLDGQLQQLVNNPPVPTHFHQVIQQCKFPPPPKLPHSRSADQVSMPPPLTPKSPDQGKKSGPTVVNLADSPGPKATRTITLEEEHAAIDSFDMDAGGEDLFNSEEDFDEFAMMEGADSSTKLTDALYGLGNPDRRCQSSSNSLNGTNTGIEGRNSSDEENRLPNSSASITSAAWKKGAGSASLLSPSKAIAVSTEPVKSIKRPLHPNCSENSIVSNKRGR